MRALLLPLLMLSVGCEKRAAESSETSSSSSSSTPLAPTTKHFNCTKMPFLNEPERQCGSAKSCTPDTCFYPDHAYCFFYSTSWATVEMMARSKALTEGREYTPTKHVGTWSDKTLSLCAPTLDECTSLRNGVGRPNDQPPVKTPCRDTPADQDPMTVPLPF